jgi:nucleoside-diphosphate-sugar epimerase
MEWRIVKIVVSGATGFLGLHLVARLSEMNFEVYGLGRDLTAGAKIKNLGAHFVAMDLAETQNFSDLPANIDAIVHCAALSSPWGRPVDFYRSNFLATQNFLNYASRANCKRFVHISSPSIYVDRFDKWNVGEDDPLPRTCLNQYIATKRLAEAAIDKANRETDLSTITLRPQGIVGRGDRAIFPRLLNIARTKGFVPRIGKGETHTDLTHVANVVEAIICALNAPKNLSGRKYNITNAESVEIYSVIERLLQKLEIPFTWKRLSLRQAYHVGALLEWTSRNLLFYREPLLTRYTACALGANRTLDITRARLELKYQPRLSLESAFDEFVNEEQGRQNG